MARGARARRPDDARLAEAFGEQWRVVAAGVDALPDAAFDAASPLPGWTVGALVAHCARSGGALAVALAAGPAAGVSAADAVDYLGGVGARAEAVADTARSDAAGPGAVELRGRLRDAVAASAGGLQAALGAGSSPGWDQVVSSPGGPIRLGDFVVTRCVEGVVHGLDLGFAPARDALRIVTRALVDLLAARAPGRSVEVRVPPFAAVQVVDGPRHTRGTPPNVVEADPVAFVEVAAGRLEWARALATGRITASGDRADLRPWLPLL
ncbi:sterol carrier family protein [Pseudofrankia sp. DC12]|uniref:sterol carrier family protein n=1 Tax=Pseudofrankia sp. DC12 TaxID=683315 RepID=UPI0005F779E8|nr:sterol carrier family protein [Pseudofrankia sp. DC12]